MTTLATTFVTSQAYQPVEARVYKVTLASATSGTVVNMIPMLKGDVVVGASMDNAALGTSVTIKLGDSVSATHFIGSIDGSIATVTGLASNRGYQYTADDMLQILIGGATASGVVTVMVLVQRNFS